MSASEPLDKASKQNYDDTKTVGSLSVPGAAWRVPTYRLCGVRCRGGVNLVRAFVRNLRTWLAMEREKVQVDEPRVRKYRCVTQGRTAP